MLECQSVALRLFNFPQIRELREASRGCSSLTPEALGISVYNRCLIRLFLRRHRQTNYLIWTCSFDASMQDERTFFAPAQMPDCFRNDAQLCTSPACSTGNIESYSAAFGGLEKWRRWSASLKAPGAWVSSTWSNELSLIRHDPFVEASR